MLHTAIRGDHFKKNIVNEESVNFIFLESSWTLFGVNCFIFETNNHMPLYIIVVLFNNLLTFHIFGCPAAL